jgi:tetratricopeptide (TPR) repeat protein
LRQTLGGVFSEVAIYAEIDPARIGAESRLTLILGASERRLPASLTAPMTRVDPDTVARWIDDASGMTLTDAHAPVENLMAPVVRASARSHGASEILRRALIRSETGDVDGFIEGCREALRQDPDLADAHYNLGVGLYRQGDVAEAVRQWERAVRLAPDYAAAQFNLGAAYYGMGRLDAALEHLRLAVRLEPRLAAGHTGLATALEAAGNLVAARDHLREALRLDPAQSEARTGLARVDARLGEQGTVGGS